MFRLRFDIVYDDIRHWNPHSFFEERMDSKDTNLSGSPESASVPTTTVRTEGGGGEANCSSVESSCWASAQFSIHHDTCTVITQLPEDYTENVKV